MLEINTKRDQQSFPSVHVVIPCWNAEQWITRAIESVLNQDYPNLGVIVIDDGSTDTSPEIIKLFGDRIRSEAGQNRGGCHARNRGMALATGDYILFLDADDYIEGNLISALVASAVSINSDICFGPSALEFSGRPREERPLPNPALSHPQLFKNFLEGGWCPPHSILWKTSFVRQIGGWNENSVRNQDGELLLTALLAKPVITVTTSGKAIYVQHDAPDRVSKRWSINAANSQIRFFEKTASVIEETDFCLALPTVGESAYELASRSSSAGYYLEARRALQLARRCGFKRHLGGPVERALTMTFGLYRKERMLQILRSIKRWLLTRHNSNARGAHG
jgi:glycosyltransferase involved in cell wall biosynthesis